MTVNKRMKEVEHCDGDGDESSKKMKIRKENRDGNHLLFLFSLPFSERFEPASSTPLSPISESLPYCHQFVFSTPVCVE
ncbi:unnamed protein product [Cuscuta campestris]|uniref:Uncharacterized protein n=1 Tax=Cuscuta campestris TaxID=132261 RepID=A0A484LWC2_9ASTE|nr:unnamed protein product [Cuscuta campestris]